MGRLSALMTGAFVGLLGDRGSLIDVDAKAREAMAAHLRSRRALALAMAGEAREAEKRQTMLRRVADLEARAVEAIRGGRDDLATQASEAIASLETEVSASEAAMGAHAASVAKLRAVVEDQRRRLSDVDRGRRLAAVRAALGEAVASTPAGTSLDATETALRALENRQADAEAVAAAIGAFGPADRGDRLVEDMAEAGFGPALRPRSRDVLERLRAKALGHNDHAGATPALTFR